MHIVLVVIWTVIIDNEDEILNIETTSTDTGGDKDLHFTILEVGDGGVTVVLVNTT